VNFNQSSTSNSSSFLPNFFGGSAGSFLNNKMLLYFIFGILFIVIAVFIYSQYTQASKPKFIPNNELGPNANNSSNEAEMLLFYVDWCPHCKTAKPAWEEVKAEYENKTINGYRVIFTEINCTNETPEVENLMNKYKIEGFPTIKLIKDGQVVEYDAKPTKATLIQFLNTVL
jgi:thiol-disulfide isomerase/thioredoxin